MSKLKGVIVLEGPDGAGKTTLAEALCKKYDGHYIHRTWRKGMDVFDHHTEALQIANQLAHEQLVVIDRLWPSEAIYGQVYRKESDYKHNSRAMDRVLLRMSALYVLCVPRNPDYVRTIHARKHAQGLEMYDNIDQVTQRYIDWLDGNELADPVGDIIDQQAHFGGFLNDRGYGAFHYDVEQRGHELDKVVEELAEHLAWYRKQQWSFALDPNTPNILGHKLHAKYLFVGEQLGDLHSWSRWPFYARTHSPDFLNKSLHEIAFPERWGAWTNAWDEDNRLPHIVAASPHLKIVALGRKAERRLNALKIPVHAAVPHPSWARRFNYHGQRGVPYPQQLADALASV